MLSTSPSHLVSFLYPSDCPLNGKAVCHQNISAEHWGLLQLGTRKDKVEVADEFFSCRSCCTRYDGQRLGAPLDCRCRGGSSSLRENVSALVASQMSHETSEIHIPLVISTRVVEPRNRPFNTVDTYPNADVLLLADVQELR